MFRYKQLNVRIPEDLHKQAKIESAKAGESLSSIITRLLQDWTNKQEKQKSK